MACAVAFPLTRKATVIDQTDRAISKGEKKELVPARPTVKSRWCARGVRTTNPRSIQEEEGTNSHLAAGVTAGYKRPVNITIVSESF